MNIILISNNQKQFNVETTFVTFDSSDLMPCFLFKPRNNH